eukprot:snap_masked-scaffold_3-processed-gene-10.43-mRNA-1 protein AED:1.00 eAED:1.00 QI:0/-1/0/0/-1/1/1/0/194
MDNKTFLETFPHAKSIEEFEKVMKPLTTIDDAQIRLRRAAKEQSNNHIQSVSYTDVAAGGTEEDRDTIQRIKLNYTQGQRGSGNGRNYYSNRTGNTNQRSGLYGQSQGENHIPGRRINPDIICHICIQKEHISRFCHNKKKRESINIICNKPSTEPVKWIELQGEGNRWTNVPGSLDSRVEKMTGSVQLLRRYC